MMKTIHLLVHCAILLSGASARLSGPRRPSKVGADHKGDVSPKRDLQAPVNVSLSNTGSTCIPQIHSGGDGGVDKTTYRIGVHAIRGLDVAMELYNSTFSDYLTATAGQHFDPPLKFELVALTFEGIFDAIESGDVDFVYSNPATYSCVGTEVGASPLVTTISRLEVRNKVYDLDVFGGVMATRADNDDINSIADFKGKIIGAGSVSVLMGGQLQFHVMTQAGLSYVNDPKQVVLTGNQFDVVRGLLSGDFDVGFIRTDQIERTTDEETGRLVDPESFKIIEPKIHILDNGELFPFLHSTPVFPEWPVAALPKTPHIVSEEVQEALLNLQEYARVAELYHECLTSESQEYCDTLAFATELLPDAPCDVTVQLAQLALRSRAAGRIAGFRPPRSYFDLRTMQQDAGYLTQDPQGDWKCARPSNFYESITCPSGFYKRRLAEFERGCQEEKLECKEGYDCFCQPCVQANEVDVYEYVAGSKDDHLEAFFGDSLPGCDKMSVCGTVMQGQTITFRIYDNKEREGADVIVILHLGDRSKTPVLTRIPGKFAYEFDISESEVQGLVVEVTVNGEQIPDSPVRVMVEPLDCDSIHGKTARRVADESGSCICERNTYELSGVCIQSQFFFLGVFTCVLFVLLILVWIYLGYKKKQNDTIWHIDPQELHFDSPPTVIGQGAFGVVILGTYRGTNVAVKRALPPSSARDSSESTSSSFSFKSHSAEIVMGSPVGTKDGRSMRHANRGRSPVRSSSGGAKKHSRNSKSLFAMQRATRSSDENIYTSHSSMFGRVLPLWMRCDEHSKHRRDFIVEMRLISRLRHPCITTVMGAVISPAVDPMLVMEYMEYGSLHDLLHNSTMYTGGEIILQMVRDIVQGVQFLHASRPPILHGDLKARNILVDSRFRAKVADFGFSHLKPNDDNVQGTLFFLAPEYLTGQSEYTASCDVYSLGMILYEIYARSNPFDGQDPDEILPEICSSRIHKRPAIPSSCPPKLCEIMKKCWNHNAFLRPTVRDLDYSLVELSIQDAEPLLSAEDHHKMPRKPASLHDVFPKHIADALNAGQKVEPESHESVTVIFSDIVGFTDISATFSPLKVSNMLDRLYSAFDQLANIHNVFKVETIGDAYMGVTNINGDQNKDHALRAAEFAMDLIQAASEILVDEEHPERGTVTVRVGFHSGPVVSNVIGTLNPRYGLFGDTVNTASRMESNSVAGKVLCSKMSADLLTKQAPDIELTPRKAIVVKGKGRMETFWVGKGLHVSERESMTASMRQLPLLKGDNTHESHDENDSEGTTSNSLSEETSNFNGATGIRIDMAGGIVNGNS